MFVEERYWSPLYFLIDKVCNENNVVVNHFFEAGAFNPTYSLGLMHVAMYPDCRVTVVEPIRFYAEQLAHAFYVSKNKDHYIYNVALSDSDSTAILHIPNEPGDKQSGSYLHGKQSAYLTRGKNSESDTTAVEVKTFKMSDIDDGTVDVLTVDVEGNEYSVISNLNSKPSVIAIELFHAEPNGYVNENVEEISDWFVDNEYELLGVNEPDFVYVRKDKVYDRSKIIASSAIEYMVSRGYNG